jgi:MFS family permease
VISRKIPRTSRVESKYFYGYIIVAVAFVIMLISLGINTAFGIFFDPLLDEFGWTRAMISVAYSISSALTGVLGIAMGLLTDKFGPRYVLTISGFLLGLGYMLISQVNTLWQFYLFYGVIVGISNGGFWIPLLSPIIRWFVQGRSLMTGIVVSGMNIGQLIAPLIIIRMIADRGWRWSCIVLGAIIMITIVILAQFMKRDPGHVNRMVDQDYAEQNTDPSPESKVFTLKKAIQTSQYLLVAIVFFCVGFSGFAVIVHIVPHAIRLGISPIIAANILAIIGGIGLIGNFLLGGIIGDKISNRKAFIISIALMDASLFWLIPSNQSWMLYLFAVIFGIGIGGMGTSESPLIASLFGKSSHGLIYGTLVLIWMIGGSVGPIVVGYMCDVIGNYQMAFLLCDVIGLAGLLLLAAVRPIKRPETVKQLMN